MNTTATRTALYYKPGGKGQWRLFAVYPTREEAARRLSHFQRSRSGRGQEMTPPGGSRGQ